MGDKQPQPTARIIKRLRRVAKWLDEQTGAEPAMAARANTCWQAAARLELLTDPDAPTCEGCPEKATTTDDAGVPLCDSCFEGLDQ